MSAINVMNLTATLLLMASLLLISHASASKSESETKPAATTTALTVPQPTGLIPVSATSSDPQKAMHKIKKPSLAKRKDPMKDGSQTAASGYVPSVAMANLGDLSVAEGKKKYVLVKKKPKPKKIKMEVYKPKMKYKKIKMKVPVKVMKKKKVKGYMVKKHHDYHMRR